MRGCGYPFDISKSTLLDLLERILPGANAQESMLLEVSKNQPWLSAVALITLHGKNEATLFTPR